MERGAEAWRGWKAPKELLWSPPRPVSLTAGGVALTVLMVLLAAGAVAAGVLLGGVAARESEERRRFRAEGIETDAVVTSQTRIRGENKRYRVEYAFEHQGRSYTGRITGSARRTAALTPGARLNVRFLPSEPAIHQAVGWERKPVAAVLVVLAPAGSLAIAGLIAIALRRQRRLLEEGRAAPAVVTGFSSAGQHGKVIKYEFPLLSGARRQGKSGPSHRVPPIGTVMCVLYDPDRPQKSAPYPLQLVKINQQR